ncbi:unnamed protein product [Leptidea sinapis]|uniref:Uncharacterized protein n=1 Tax=Leptidea sinapis TaxID=189913 RepID=A0A5E4PV44_9NEOP|nr:unnamed protein product [Leptidea sinapis]
MGDMNIDIQKLDPIIKQYLNTLSDLGFSCGISNNCTSIEKLDNNITKSCIDHVLIRDNSKCDIYTSVANVAPADHSIIGCALLGVFALNNMNNTKPLQLANNFIQEFDRNVKVKKKKITKKCHFGKLLNPNVYSNIADRAIWIGKATKEENDKHHHREMTYYKR